MTPEQFIAKWRDNKLSERAGAQPHFIDLCNMLGVETPSDPDNYCFERGAKRTGAGRGWADVWMRHNFAWEYKAPNANLETALKQLMTYALALDNPPLLVVSDRLRIEIHTHFTGTPSELHTIALADIGTPENLQKLRWLFADPEKFKPQRTRAAITLQAAKLIGDLAVPFPVFVQVRLTLNPLIALIVEPIFDLTRLPISKLVVCDGVKTTPIERVFNLPCAAGGGRQAIGWASISGSTICPTRD